MPSIQRCPECGTPWPDNVTCESLFHQMLFWEAENPALGEVHHLTVLCYHLQHPSLYSPDGLREGRRLLVGFLCDHDTPSQARRTTRANVDSSRRTWKIKGTPGLQGAVRSSSSLDADRGGCRGTRRGQLPHKCEGVGGIGARGNRWRRKS